MDDKIDIVNYASDAIDDLITFAKFWKTRDAASAAVTMKLVELLRTGIKFLLPNCAEIVDGASLGEAHLELMHLPYPVTIFEAPWVMEDEFEPILNGSLQTRSTRRIAACWDMADKFEPFPGLHAPFRERFPEGGTFIVSVYYLDQVGAWSPSCGGLFVPRDFRIDDNFEYLPASIQATEAMRAAGRASGKPFRFRAEPFSLVNCLFAEAVAKFGGDPDMALSQVLVDTHDSADGH
ncbi:MAG: hypothetical protein AB1704_42425 [Pseudomonadota bacterium]